MGIAGRTKRLGLLLSKLGRWEAWKRVPLRLRIEYLAPNAHGGFR